MEILCRYGEMILKSKPVRHGFTRRLVANIQQALKTIDPTSSISLKQAFLSIRSDRPECLEVLSRVFGIASIAYAMPIGTSEFREILSRGSIYFREAVEGRRFAVRCKRIGRHTFRSIDVERELGGLLADHGRVDLSHPEIICWVEIRDDITSFSCDTRKGPGGLPIGTQGKGICLISGGFDSPVAAWYALRRGIRLDYLFCCLGGPFQLWGPRAAAKVLADRWSYGYAPQFYHIDFTGILSEIGTVDHAYRNILLKSFFYQAAEQLCRQINADTIVTGEILGQVSSQTLSNLSSISRRTDCFIFRPLIAFDKNDVFAKAREIMTYPISEKVPEFCNVAVSKPRTVSHIDIIAKLESTLSPDLIPEAMKTIYREDLKAMQEPPFPEDNQIKMAPSNAFMVWILTPDSSAPEGHFDAVIGSSELKQWIKSLPKDRPIVLDCRRGSLSKDFAAYLREKGFESYHLKKA